MKFVLFLACAFLAIAMVNGQDDAEINKASREELLKICQPRDWSCIRRQLRHRLRAAIERSQKIEVAVGNGTTSTKLPATIVKSVEAAVAAASNAPSDAVAEGEKAIAALKERVASFESKRRECKDLKDKAARRKCSRALRKEVKNNKKERRLVRKLEACAKRFSDNAIRRTNCVARVVRVLMQLVKPVKKDDAPNSIPDLENEEAQLLGLLRQRLVRLTDAAAQCSTDECRADNTRQVEAVRREMVSLDARFGPRRVCLVKRRKFRLREFRIRAAEHLRLYRIHRRASRCETMRCARKQEKRQHKLEDRIRKARFNRKAQWNHILCPLILPTTTQPTTTTESTTTVAPVTRKPGVNSKIAELHLELNKLYLSLDACETKLCKRRLRKQIKRVNNRLRKLWARRNAELKDLRDRHARRARLHRKLNKLYLRAARCTSDECNIRTRALLSKFKKALQKLNRTALGSKRNRNWTSLKLANRYIRMLRNKLSLCDNGEAGKDCRKRVFSKFRKESELRDRAVLYADRKLTLRRVKKQVKKCKGDKACLDKVRLWEEERITQLQIRLIQLERRRALRLCKKTADVSACRKSVNAEFKRDTTVVAKQAAEVAKKDVQSAVRKSVGSSAASLAVSVLAVMLVALLF